MISPALLRRLGYSDVGPFRHVDRAFARPARRIIAISDAIVASYCKHINDEVWSRRSFFQIGQAQNSSLAVVARAAPP